jgi:hypothetical protein
LQFQKETSAQILQLQKEKLELMALNTENLLTQHKMVMETAMMERERAASPVKMITTPTKKETESDQISVKGILTSQWNVCIFIFL